MQHVAIILVFFTLCRAKEPQEGTAEDFTLGVEYVHVDKPVCTETEGRKHCNYHRQLAKALSIRERKKEVSDCLRILAALGKGEGIDGHITVRVPPPTDGNQTAMLVGINYFNG